MVKWISILVLVCMISAAVTSGNWGFLAIVGVVFAGVLAFYWLRGRAKRRREDERADARAEARQRERERRRRSSRLDDEDEPIDVDYYDGRSRDCDDGTCGDDPDQPRASDSRDWRDNVRNRTTGQRRDRSKRGLLVILSIIAGLAVLGYFIFRPGSPSAPSAPQTSSQSTDVEDLTRNDHQPTAPKLSNDDLYDKVWEGTLVPGQVEPVYTAFMPDDGTVGYLIEGQTAPILARWQRGTIIPGWSEPLTPGEQQAFNGDDATPGMKIRLELITPKKLASPQTIKVYVVP